MEGNYLCEVRFYPSHVIYQAHFQGNPITPGACIIQIIKELSGILTHKKLFIKGIRNLKFLNSINPHQYPEVMFQITLKPDEEGSSYTSKALVYKGETVFAKLDFSLVTD